jgi:site-specific recombinase XerD
MNSKSFAITFLLKKDKQNKQHECPIYARVSINTQRIFFSTKLVIHPRFWEDKKNEVKKAHKQHVEMNNMLQAIKGKIYNCYTELLHQKKEVSTKAIKDLYNGVATPSVSTLLVASEYHLQEMEQFLGKSATYGNFKNYKTTHKYLGEFIAQFFKQKDIGLEEINYTFLKQYEFFLQQNKNCAHNGAMKQMQRLKKILNWAIKNEFLQDNPFKSYTISFKKFDRGFLTQHEIEQLEKLDRLSKKLQYTKDFFIFQLYTGLSYEDMIDLNSDDIVQGIDNHYWIIKSRIKTDTKITVPLLDNALKILNKYACLYERKQQIFPRISNQKINKNLKELGALAGIMQPLSTHLARHSAATTIWLSNGVSLEVVSKMLGHTKITTTQIYGRIAEQKIADEMAVLKEKLSALQQK